MRELQKLSNNIEDYPEGIVLNVYKPYRWTSADVIRKIKFLSCRHFGKKNLKVGHAGTLDPLATGVLLVCIGNATKKAEELQKHNKEYIAGISLGATTASYDLEKEIYEYFPTTDVKAENIQKALGEMLGEQDQIAPLFSAKSIDGVRAYELARKLYKECKKNGTQSLDLDSPIRAAKINIHELELLNFSHDGKFAQYAPKKDNLDTKARINVTDISNERLPLAEVRIKCSKGTYVRAFARDLGEKLNSGGFLSYLIRSRSGIYKVEDSYTLNELISLFE